MAQTNRDRVHRALDLLLEGLKPFVEREFQAQYGPGWRDTCAGILRGQKEWVPQGGEVHLDVQALLFLMWEQWNVVFRATLGHAERSLVSELRAVRNRDAHQEIFSTDDAYRALDSIQRLLLAVSAAQEVGEVEQQKADLLRQKFREQTRTEVRRTTTAPTEGKPQPGLRPWREIMTPHPDVASGRYVTAEFAADLNQVYQGMGEDEYRDPREFFSRTFVTEGLRELLVEAVRRLTGAGGDPIVELQTNFGGGKTHSMLALYHAFSGAAASSLPGMEPILSETGAVLPARVRRAVLVGTALNPARERRKPDGIETCTLWGEMAWQLLGEDGYAMVADADRRGVSPGTDALMRLFEEAAPCLILIDEWVAFMRQLYHVHNLVAGSFEANLSFAQALTEAARAVPRTLVVASLPASQIEIGGEGGQAALDRLSNTFSRMAEHWRPASTEEGFEIVRRRLFQPIADPTLYPARDAVVHAFVDQYRAQAGEFPVECRESEYERRMQAAYPIHPELFDRLYGDWSTLDKFQRTRGMLRLMAAVIHTLWERQDSSLMILPAMVPIDEQTVQSELKGYLDDPWIPVIETDVDGPHSLPLQLDREIPNLGRYSAARRVARTVFMGSAPTLHAASKGKDERTIKLGCTQPGENASTFGDALRRLSDRSAHLYGDGNRYWYSTQPSVARLAADRAAQLHADDVWPTIEERLRKEAATRGEFHRVHVTPSSGADVPDEREARLVILRPAFTHIAKNEESDARREASSILQGRGAGPRLYTNSLVFLAADGIRLRELEAATRLYLAWESIVKERETLNLDPFQENQASAKMAQQDTAVKRQIPEVYQWLLAPTQQPGGPLEWQEFRLQGDEPLAPRASRKLCGEELLVTSMAGTILRYHLDRIPLWRGEDVNTKQLWEDFCRYLYLPRLRDDRVLKDAIADGAGSLLWRGETFAYAERKDEVTGKYLGVKAGDRPASVALDGYSYLVKPDAVVEQQPAPPPPVSGDSLQDRVERAVFSDGRFSAGDIRLRVNETRAEVDGSLPRQTDIDDLHQRILSVAEVRDMYSLVHLAEVAAPVEPTVMRRTEPPPPPPPVVRRKTRYHGSVELDSFRVARAAGQIAEEVIQHLTSLNGARVQVTLEIEAEVHDGIPDHVVNIVLANGSTLKFTSQDFEEE